MYRFQVYNSAIHHLYIALCAHHPKPSLLPSPFIAPLPSSTCPHLPSAPLTPSNHHSTERPHYFQPPRCLHTCVYVTLKAEAHCPMEGSVRKTVHTGHSAPTAPQNLLCTLLSSVHCSPSLSCSHRKYTLTLPHAQRVTQTTFTSAELLKSLISHLQHLVHSLSTSHGLKIFYHFFVQKNPRVVKGAYQGQVSPALWKFALWKLTFMKNIH